MQNKNTKRRLVILLLTVLGICGAYLLIDAHPENPKLFRYILSRRLPTLTVMVIAATAIGASSIVFQSIANNRIVTPGLLGMSSMYTLIHTAVVFLLSSAHPLVSNTNISFLIDLLLMALSAYFVYSHLFCMTGNNLLYILLMGTVLSSLFGSIQSSMIRIMDPNEYDALLTTLVADFNNVKTEVILISSVLLGVLALVLRKDLGLLDVIALGKSHAVNLGVDYDRTIRRLLLGVALCTCVATAMVGPLSFLGLIVANLARQIMQTYRHRYVISGSALIAVAATIGGQILSQHVFHYEVPIGTLITICGGVYFLYLLLFRKGGI